MNNPPRPLTSSETIAFLARHPEIAAEVAETEAVQDLGLYDYDYNPATEWIFPGVIPPWGVEVADNVFDFVVVFPARDGSWRYSGYVPELGDINDPGYVSPAPEGSALDDLASLGKLALGVGVVWLLIAHH